MVRQLVSKRSLTKLSSSKIEKANHFGDLPFFVVGTWFLYPAMYGSSCCFEMCSIEAEFDAR